MLNDSCIFIHRQYLSPCFLLPFLPLSSRLHGIISILCNSHPQPGASPIPARTSTWCKPNTCRTSTWCRPHARPHPNLVQTSYMPTPQPGASPIHAAPQPGASPIHAALQPGASPIHAALQPGASLEECPHKANPVRLGILPGMI